MKRMFFIIFLLSVPLSSPAQELASQPEPVTADAIEESIDEVISRPEYTWRLPRDKKTEEDLQDSAFISFWKKIGEWTDKIFEPIRKFFKRIGDWMDRKLNNEPVGPVSKSEPRDWRNPVRLLMFLTLAVAASVLGIVLYRMIKRRKAKGGAIAAATTAPPISLDDDAAATQLPTDEWMELAAQFLENGDLRMAIRAMFLGCLSSLAHKEHIVIARHKSNRDYIQELERRAHDREAMLGAFTANVALIERIWYGMHNTTTDMLRTFTDNRDTIIHDA